MQQLLQRAFMTFHPDLERTFRTGFAVQRFKVCAWYALFLNTVHCVMLVQLLTRDRAKYSPGEQLAHWFFLLGRAATVLPVQVASTCRRPHWYAATAAWLRVGRAMLLLGTYGLSRMGYVRHCSSVRNLLVDVMASQVCGVVRRGLQLLAWLMNRLTSPGMVPLVTSAGLQADIYGVMMMWMLFPGLLLPLTAAYKWEAEWRAAFIRKAAAAPPSAADPALGAYAADTATAAAATGRGMAGGAGTATQDSNAHVGRIVDGSGTAAAATAPGHVERVCEVSSGSGSGSGTAQGRAAATRHGVVEPQPVMGGRGNGVMQQGPGPLPMPEVPFAEAERVARELLCSARRARSVLVMSPIIATYTWVTLQVVLPRLAA